jgi:hypothetical protein
MDVNRSKWITEDDGKVIGGSINRGTNWNEVVLEKQRIRVFSVEYSAIPKAE